MGALAIIAALFASYNGADKGMVGLENLIENDVASERGVKVMLLDFKTQVQEWKNTLLRGHDTKQREKYWSRFQQREADVQNEGKKLLVKLKGTDSADIVERFLRAHKSMGTAYRDGFDAFVAQGYDHKAGDKAASGIDREPSKLLQQAAEKIAESVWSVVKRRKKLRTPI